MPKMDFLVGDKPKTGELCVSVLFDKDKLSNSGGDVFALISMTAPEIEQTQQRVPLNISACIDVSGSMNGDKIVNVKKALNKMIQHLTDKDVMGVVAFNGMARDVFPPCAMTQENKDKAKKVINDIYANGGTNLSSGLFMSAGQLKVNKGDYINRILVFSDGEANEGIQDVNILSENMKEYLVKSSLSTFGFGSDYAVDMMQKLANTGKGNTYHIQTAENIPSAFAKELGGLLSVFAQNIEASITLPEGVTISDNFSEEFGKGNIFNINDIYSQESRNILLKLKAEAGIGTKTVRVAVTYNDIVLKSQAGLSASNTFELVEKALETPEKDINKKVAEQIVIHVSAKAQASAIRFANSGDYINARLSLDTARGLVMTMDGNVGIGALAANTAMDLSSALSGYADADAYSMSANMLRSKSVSYSTGRGAADNLKNTFTSAVQDALIKDFADKDTP